MTFKVGDFADVISDFDKKYDEFGERIGEAVEDIEFDDSELDDLSEDIKEFGDNVEDFIEGEPVLFEKIYEEGLDHQSMMDLWGLNEYKNEKKTSSM